MPALRLTIPALVVVLSASAFPASGNAALITSAADLAPSVVIDFSQFDTGSYTFTAGPTQVGALVGEDVVFTAVGPGPGFGGGGYGLVSNGFWDDPLGSGNGRDGFAFINSSGISMTFTFNSGPVQGVGAFINYCPECAPGPARIEALDLLGQFLEGYDIEIVAPIITTGQTNAGAFRGISRATADIGAFRLVNRITVADDLTFTRVNTPVPEPGTLGLLGVGLASLGFAARWRKHERGVL